MILLFCVMYAVHVSVLYETCRSIEFFNIHVFDIKVLIHHKVCRKTVWGLFSIKSLSVWIHQRMKTRALYLRITHGLFLLLFAVVYEGLHYVAVICCSL